MADNPEYSGQGGSCYVHPNGTSVRIEPGQSKLMYSCTWYFKLSRCSHDRFGCVMTSNTVMLLIAVFYTDVTVCC